MKPHPVTTEGTAESMKFSEHKDLGYIGGGGWKESSLIPDLKSTKEKDC